QAQLTASQSVIASIADKNILHKNTAARYISRLSAAVKAMA
ncbi:MAG: 30S ribosomal protein S20, partial [Betaproteobacteria bacterium]|nr:30S ribosomal protein S20 [Betaproteobacteria bacterium]